jgi:two-component system CAI-1 autoinducer sensor kinase/phosphatase CqsS
MNAASAPIGQQIDILWILQYFIALFVFFQVLYNGFLATTLWLLSTATALSPLVFLDHPNYNEIHRVILYPLVAYLTAVGLGILTNRQSDILDTERLRAASAIGANLAHELRTPLASINNLSGGVDRLLPLLVDAYEKAKQAGIEVKSLRNSQLTALRRALTSIQNEVMYSNTIIDMLLVNTAGKPMGDPDLEALSAQACINEAVSRFPFNNDHERSLVNVHVKEDFTINGPRLLIVHVLFNLIKNSLQYVQRSKNARVDISATEKNGVKQIVVFDNGPGIPEHDLPHIFERFYTTNKTGQGAGIGLSFCKMVMESIGGDISCDTSEGEYTRFTLTFPGQRHLVSSPQTRVNTLRNLHRRSTS